MGDCTFLALYFYPAMNHKNSYHLRHPFYSFPSSGFFFFSSRRRHTRSLCDWSSDVCSSDLTRDRIEKQAEQHDTVIFAVGLFGDADRATQGRHELDQLADRTGGVGYYPAGIDQIDAVALEIAQDRKSVV